MRKPFRRFDKDVRSAGLQAARHLQELRPELRVHYGSLRAEEGERFVFTVFYSRPDQATKPSPYALVVVPKDGGPPEQIKPPRESGYWLRGRK